MTTHPSKVLFHYISILWNEPEIQVYIKYLDNGMDFRLNYQLLSESLSTDLSLASSFYGKPSEAPQFFNFLSFSDLTRLNNNVMPSSHCIALYRPKKKNQNEFIKVYDETTISKVFKHPNMFTKHTFLLLDNNQIAYSPTMVSPMNSERTLVGSKRSDPSDQISVILNELLGTHFPIHYNMNNLTNDPGVFYEFDMPILICCHSGCKLNRYDVKCENFYSNFGIFNENNKNSPKIIVITMDLDNKFLGYLPNTHTYDDILKKCVTSPGRLTDTNKYMESVLSKNQQIITNQKTKQKKETIENWKKHYHCHCDCCKIAIDNYSSNVNLEGPQPRYAIEPDIFEFLNFFNLNTDENRKSLNTIFKLSIASLDIESFAKMHEHPDKKLSSASYIGQTQRVISTQEFALIGYGDCFDIEKISEHYKVFSVKNSEKEETKSAKLLVDELIKHIFERYEFVIKEKENLLSKLYAFIEVFKECHEKFWSSEVNPPSQKERDESFNRGFCGKFLSHLDKIKKSYYIYTFNGGGFDLILLHKFLATHFKSQGHQKPLRILKKMSRIQKLSVPKTGIHFVDICDVIGRGTTLNGFAQMTGQKQFKLKFPFGSFKSANFLFEKKLPTDEASWFNDLQQYQPTSKEIDEAIQDFNRLQCANIGEYLKAYLKSK